MRLQADLEDKRGKGRLHVGESYFPAHVYVCISIIIFHPSSYFQTRVRPLVELYSIKDHPRGAVLLLLTRKQNRSV